MNRFIAVSQSVQSSPLRHTRVRNLLMTLPVVGFAMALVMMCRAPRE